MSSANSSVSSSPIHTPTTARESRSANEALQRVANVMIAVTESCRQQFREQYANDDESFGRNGRRDSASQVSTPDLVSPTTVDDNDNYEAKRQTNHLVSSPRLNLSTWDSNQAPKIHVLPVMLTLPRNPTVPQLRRLSYRYLPIAQTRTPNTSNLHRDVRISQPGLATHPRNQMNDFASHRRLAPGGLEHTLEYPDLFEAARRIVFTRRVKHSVEATLSRMIHENSTQAEGNEERLSWTQHSKLHQSLPLLNKAPRPQLPSAQKTWLVGVAMAPALGISQSFTNVGSGQHSWFTAAYALTVGVFDLPSARLGDTFGRKPVTVLGCLWRWNGTVYFCICRVMQGIGPALCISNGFTTLEMTLVPGQKKDKAISIFSASAPVGFALGTVMSSLFARGAAWEWSFFVLAAVSVSAGGLGLLVLPCQALTKKHSGNSIWVRLDLSGTVRGASGLMHFSLSCNQAPAVAWQTPYCYFFLIVGAMFFAAFTYNETVVVNPLLPLNTIGSVTNLILTCTAAVWGCFAIWAFYTFQLLVLLREWNSLMASTSPVYWASFVAVLSLLLASILMATAPPEQTHWANAFVSSLLAPLEMVVASPLATTMLRENLPEEQKRIASSVVLARSSYAISFFMGIASSVEVQVNQGGSDVLSGCRGAQYSGVGLGSLRVLLVTAITLQAVFVRGS
ncbi:Putative major facilitator superfamily, MFS transporter superfamily [Colletotrichum destructivum]|uniref:Major facilitator superfamily, MFS transporter superfamily n=1 Tax=Colletotrichum destructivum TaxID=34406 RepID=A0AAX4I4R1_9PEZI|nr:Putative major facilitator superfamily, MFS transporter superfamily [Colletotrichum destructivum]